MRELARAEVSKPLPVVAKLVEPVPAPLVPAAAPAFERPAERRVIPRPLETGLFERTNGARLSQAAAAVTTGGFGSAAASPRGAANGTGAVTTGGFSSGAPAPRGAANGSGANGSDNVQTAGFDLRASAPAQPSMASLTKPIDRPVEIVFKPTPEYTDEARSARIEGTVSLELEFTAAGDVRVLRVVRGLGHGLDEAAQRAALRIRFKPAQSDGQPVDSRATVHITFRLS
jgi:TonB family protein